MGYSFEYQRPVREIVGDRLLLTMLVSFVTIIFTWVVAFPIGIYSATHQYSWGDYGLTFLGPDRPRGAAFPAGAGLHVLRQCLVRHLDRRARRSAISQPADELGQVHVDPRASLDPGDHHRGRRHGGHDPRGARQSARRAAEAVLRHRPRQGPAAGQGAAQISAAHVAELLHLRYRRHPALDRLRRRDRRDRAVAADHRAAADPGAAERRTCISPAPS